MTVKRKKKGTFMGGRTATVAFSLCLLAVVAMIGMYTVGKSEQREKQLEQQVAEEKKRQAEELAKQEEEQRIWEQEQEERQAAASASAERQKETEEEKKEKEIEKEETASFGAELESDFQADQTEVAENIVIDEMEEVSGEDIMTEEPTLSFSADTDMLLWPIAGNIILDYSMDKSIYFSTLNQYKYNPAVIIQGSENDSVMCAAQGRVETIETLDETGMTVTMDIGDGYELIYGQLKELTVKEGDYLKAGETLGYVSQPTKYFANEGCNLYFAVRKDGENVDPMTLLQ